MELKGLHRAKEIGKLNNGEWIYGNIVYKLDEETGKHKWFIYSIWEYPVLTKKNQLIEIDESSIGRYMNKNDIDDVWIFEGDFVKCDLLEGGIRGDNYILVTSDYDYDIKGFLFLALHYGDFNIIGNKYEGI